MVTPAKVQMDLSLEGDKSVKSHLLQGIFDLFLETLNIYNNHLGDLKKISTQLLITLFMAWSLLEVILVELLLFVESVIVFVWRLLVRLVKLMRIKDNTKVLIDETQKRHAKRERQKAQRREQERRRQEEQEEREYLRETERQKELMIVEASLSQEAERESLSTSLVLEQSSASSQSVSEALVEESKATSESEAVSESAKSEK